MPFNGAGAYSLPAGSIVADGTTIDAADHNTPLQDIESSLSAVTLRNGATPFTGNQSFGNNKITVLAAGTVATDGATLAQAQSQASNRATAVGGTANAVTLTFSPPFAAYTNGMRVRWRATASNTGAMTVNADGLGAKNFQMDASGALAATFSGAVVSGMFIEAEYNSASDVFVWLNQKPVFVDSNGFVGIGGAPSFPLDVISASAAGNAPFVRIRNTSGSTIGSFGPGVSLSNSVAGKHGFFVGMQQSSNSEFVISNSDSPFTQYAQFTQNGDFLLGTTVFTAGSAKLTVHSSDNANKLVVSGYGSSLGVGAVFRQANDTSPVPVVFQNAAGTQIGSITTTAAATAYNTTSDYRLKESVLPLHGALAKVAQLKPCSYTWKVDGSAGEGFIAHELQNVIPLAVTGEKDAVSDDGSPAYQAVDLSKVVPVLVAAIQELAAEVADLRARVNAA
jgi:hypothetical protein